MNVKVEHQPSTKPQPIRQRLDEFFHISERGSSFGQEARGGLVSFFAMAYIIILNPVILGSQADVTGRVLPIPALAAVTALTAGVMTIAFGLIAHYPFGIAAGLGINSLLAVTISQHVSWSEAMGLVVIDGIIIVLLAITGFRMAVFSAIPAPLKSAIIVGIGMFIALIGLVDAGFVRRLPDSAHTTVPLGLGIGGSIQTLPTVVFIIGVILCSILVVRQVRGGLLIGIIATTILSILVEKVAHVGSSVHNPKGWNLSVPRMPDSVGGLPDLHLLGNISLYGAVTRIGPIAAAMFVFTLVLANFFDAMGTMTGLGNQAGLNDKDGNLPNMKRAFVVEGCGAIVGGLTCSSSNTVFVDSAAGIGDGARTGFANIVTGLSFLVALFLTPLCAIVPIEAASPALVVVGAMMMGEVRSIDFSQFSIALPAFLTIVAMPFTYSIANGIGVGFIMWTVIHTAMGKGKELHPLMWVVSILFVLYFASAPLQLLLGVTP